MKEWSLDYTVNWLTSNLDLTSDQIQKLRSEEIDGMTLAEMDADMFQECCDFSEELSTKIAKLVQETLKKK